MGRDSDGPEATFFMLQGEEQRENNVSYIFVEQIIDYEAVSGAKSMSSMKIPPTNKCCRQIIMMNIITGLQAVGRLLVCCCQQQEE